jgi:N-acetylmuramoyl-L-alanine amidase
MRPYFYNTKHSPLLTIFTAILAIYIVFSSTVIGAVILKSESGSTNIDPISSDPLLLPLYEVVSYYGIEPQWNVVQEQMIISKDNTNVRLTLGNQYALVNESKLMLLSVLPAMLRGTVVISPKDTVDIMSELIPSLNFSYDEASTTISVTKKDDRPNLNNAVSQPESMVTKSSDDEESDLPGNFELKTIVIDPGHGGHDAGANRAGVLEKNIVLDVSLRLAELLKLNTNLKVVLTRDTDVFIPLSGRTDIANKYPADSTLFLCIHCNSVAAKSGGYGTETYVFNLEATDNEARALASRENEGEPMDLTMILSHCYHAGTEPYSLDIAKRTLKTLTDELDLSSRGVRHAAFYVLAGTKMPATLIELAYVSNPSEREKLQSESFRQRAAEALFHSIMDFKGVISKSVAKSKINGEIQNP